MTRDDCGRMEPEISALLDGELAAPEAAAVEAHVRACPACAALARDLAAVGRTLRGWESEEPEAAVSPGFRARLLAEVASERRSARPTSPRPADPRNFPPFVAWTLPVALAASVFFAIHGLLSDGGLFGDLDRIGGGGSPAIEQAAPLTASDHLRFAEAHRLAGRGDLERLSVLAAWGLAPSDPAVREAFARSLGFDPAALEALPAGGPPAGAPAVADAGPAPTDEGAPVPDAPAGAPGLWIGSWRFETPGAYDDYLAFHDRLRELEIASAAREAVRRPDAASVAAARPEAPRPDPFTRALAALEVGAPVGGDGTPAYQGIVVFPLRAKEGFAAAAGETPLGLEEALHPRSRRAQVSETQGRSAGSVLVSNLDRRRDLLVLAGQVLEGGRADRMVARDTLVPAGARNAPIPVYDVEAGSGPGRSWATRFQAVAGTAGPRFRALALARAEPAEMREFVRRRLDLLDVTGLRRSLAGAYDERGAAAPYLRSVREQVRVLLAGLREPGVVGFAVAQGRDLLSVELFGSHALLLREAPRVLEGCALEALTCSGGGPAPAREEVAAMLAAAGRGAAFRGAGEAAEVGFLSLEGGLLGSGVARDGTLLHATVLRGAGSGALAGRPVSGGDLPGTGAPPAAPPRPSGEGEDRGGAGGGEGSGTGTPSPAGSGETRPPDGPAPDQRPR